MRQQKNHSRIMLICLIVLFLLLNIPKTYQLNTLLGTLLNPEEMMFYISYRSFFILLVLGLELLGAFLNIYILKYVYHFAKLNISMIANINLYLCIQCLTKFVSLFIPQAIMRGAPFLNGLIFSGFYILFHYHHAQNNQHSIKEWSILLSYPCVNLLFSIL